jgi:hypothetical protein
VDILHFLAGSVQPLDAARGVQAYSGASEAYAGLSFDSAVALWALGIAGAAVAIEWLLGRTGRRR